MRRDSRVNSQAFIPAVALIVCAAAVYLPRLRDAPVSLRPDEVTSALSARSLATTGRDLNGRFLPLFFYPREHGLDWSAPPVMVYAIALVLKVAPFSESTIRAPMVILGLVDIVLVYAIAWIIFRRTWLAAAAAGLLAFSPAHFIHARYALPAQISTPFILGWMLCLLIHLRRPDRRWLFAGGALLFLAALGYFAVFILLPVYALLTWYMLRSRWEPSRSVVYLIAGAAIPALACLPWVLVHAAAIRDIFAHYYWGAGGGTGGMSHLMTIASLYWHFFDPRFLFITSSARLEFSTGLAGVFLLPTAGLLAVGAVAAARRREPDAILLLGGFLTAPLPASLVGEGHAIWRALEVVPFGALLATFGLASISQGGAVGRAGLAAVFGIVACLAATNHAHLPFAQAMLRAAIVPIAIGGLATLLRGFVFDSRKLLPIATTWLAAVVLIQTVLARSGYFTLVLLCSGLVAALGVAMFLPDRLSRRTAPHPVLIGTLLGVVASAFIFFHVERSIVFTHPRAVLAAMRFAAVATTLAVALGLATIVPRVPPGRAPQWRTAAIVAMIGLQVTYFYIDRSPSIGIRFLCVSIVLLVSIALGMVIRQIVSRDEMCGPLMAAGLLTIGSIQFAYFYADYLTAYQIRYQAGNLPGTAWETVIAHAKAKPVPAVYLPLGGTDVQYWQFYLIKHDYETLATRTVTAPSEEGFTADRIHRLPAGTIIMAPTGHAQVDNMIDRLVADDALTDLTPRVNPMSTFWILERTAKN